MKKNKPTLYIFAGLPGTGKSTLAAKLATKLQATFLRIDTIEQGIRDLCSFKVEGEGYRLSYRIAKDNLIAGNNVIADSCNPIKLTRDEWEDTATSVDALFVNIEIICSDKAEHQKRVETRKSTVPNLCLPNWTQVVNREYHSWDRERIVVDTAGKSVDEAFEELIFQINSCSGF